LQLVCVFSCTVLFVSISQVTGCEDCLPYDLDCVGWGIKLNSNSKLQKLISTGFSEFELFALLGSSNLLGWVPTWRTVRHSRTISVWPHSHRRPQPWQTCMFQPFFL